jgi:hypothetical protein
MKGFVVSILAATSAVVLPICAGCHHAHGDVYIQESAPPPGYVVATAPPPPIVVEPRPVAPAVGYVWVDGYWHWTGRQYTWHRGYWAVPPRGYQYWVAPRYERHGHEYRYVPGHWDRR